MDKLLKCKICGFEGKSLITHLKYKHLTNTEEYQKIYGMNCKTILISESQRKKASEIMKLKNKDEDFRKLNADRQKNGASIFTIKYWLKKGYTEEEAKKQISEIQKKNSEQSILKTNYQESSILCKKYWIKRGKTEIEAEKIIKNHQINASSKSSKFLGHKRTEESKKKISDSLKEKIKEVGTDNWIKHFGEFDGTSKVEIECFHYIKENVDNMIESNVVINPYVVDIIKDKKIIEFYGDYWHGNPKIYQHNDFVRKEGNSRLLAEDIWKKDNKRLEHLKKMGYNVLIVWENDWNKNKNECIKKIKKYLL